MTYHFKLVKVAKIISIYYIPHVTLINKIYIFWLISIQMNVKYVSMILESMHNFFKLQTLHSQHFYAIFEVLKLT